MILTFLKVFIYTCQQSGQGHKGLKINPSKVGSHHTSMAPKPTGQGNSHTIIWRGHTECSTDMLALGRIDSSSEAARPGHVSANDI